jgi:hypothetical protein
VVVSWSCEIGTANLRENVAAIFQRRNTRPRLSLA